MLKHAECFLYWDEHLPSTPRNVSLRVVHLAGTQEKVVCKMSSLGTAVHDDCEKARSNTNSATVKLTLPAIKMFGTKQRSASYNQFFFVCSYTIGDEATQRTIRSHAFRLVTNSEPETLRPLGQPQRERMWTFGKPTHSRHKQGLLLFAFCFLFGIFPVKAVLSPFRILGTQVKRSKKILLASVLICIATAWALSHEESLEQQGSPPERLEQLLHDLMTISAFNEHARPTVAELDERLEPFHKAGRTFWRSSPKPVAQQTIAVLRKRLVLVLLVAVPGGAASGSRVELQQQQAIVDLQERLEALTVAKSDEQVQQIMAGLPEVLGVLREAIVLGRRGYAQQAIADCHESLALLPRLASHDAERRALQQPIADMHEWLELLRHDLMVVAESEERAQQTIADLLHERWGYSELVVLAVAATVLAGLFLSGVTTSFMDSRHPVFTTPQNTSAEP